MDHLLQRLGLGSFDAWELLSNVVVLAIAFGLALPIGWDRERATRAMGIRTFPLVALSSAAFVIVGRSLAADVSASASSRIIQGLITGIGFLGGGAILKKGDRVRGTATAAAIWGTAALGAAVAYGLLEVAVVLAVASFLVLRFLQPVKETMNATERWDDGEPED